MNAAATHLESDIANGEETRKFLGQSVGFENELIGQKNFPPISRACEVPSRAANFLPLRAGSPGRLGNRPGPAASGAEYAVNGGD
jgi:hypothetical protein